MAFDMLHCKNSFTKGFKAAVLLENLLMWMQQCDKLASYLLTWKDEKGYSCERIGRRMSFWVLCSV